MTLKAHETFFRTWQVVDDRAGREWTVKWVPNYGDAYWTARNSRTGRQLDPAGPTFSKAVAAVRRLTEGEEK